MQLTNIKGQWLVKIQFAIILCCSSIALLAQLRSVTGDVVAINQGVAARTAIFEVEAIQGTIISLQNGPDITLAGSNGGTMNLHLGGSSPGSPFISRVTPPGRTQVFVGGTLTIGSPLVSKAGTYNGTFSIMFIQQ